MTIVEIELEEEVYGKMKEEVLRLKGVIEEIEAKKANLEYTNAQRWSAITDSVLNEDSRRD